MSKPYKTCPDCGDHLDAGEICDCKDATAKDTAPEATRNPRGPVLVPGA